MLVPYLPGLAAMKVRLARTISLGCQTAIGALLVFALVGAPIMIDEAKHYPWWVGYLAIDGSLLVILAGMAALLWADNTTARGKP